MARRTLAEYVDAVEHQLGNSPSAGVTSLQLVNDALRELCSVHAWKWRNGGPYTLDLTADQSYVELPADFGELNSLTYPGTLLKSMTPTTFAQLQRMRATEVLSPQYQYYYAINTGRIDDDFPEEGLSIQVIELYPTPTESVTDALTITYLRDVPDLELDADVPQIPLWLDHCLMLLVRAKAAVIEDDDPDSPSIQEYNRVFKQMIARDSRSQTRYGIMRGGLYPQADGLDPLYPSSIADPSDAP